jgi:hypothetical protein
MQLDSTLFPHDDEMHAMPKRSSDKSFLSATKKSQQISVDNGLRLEAGNFEALISTEIHGQLMIVMAQSNYRLKDITVMSYVNAMISASEERMEKLYIAFNKKGGKAFYCDFYSFFQL